MTVTFPALRSDFRFRVVVAVVVASAALAGVTTAEENTVLPAVSTEELRTFQEVGLPFVLVDARGPEIYARGHLPRAINVPVDQVEPLGLSLPRDARIVTYCGGPTCGASVTVGRWLLAHGFSRVWHYPTGFPTWQAAGYPVEVGLGAPPVDGTSGCASGAC